MILIQKISEIIGKLISPLIIKRLSKMSLNVDLPNQLTNNKSTNTININKWSTFTDIALGYDLGLARSYLQSKWDCSDLTQIFKLMINNSSNKNNTILNYTPEKFISRIQHKIKSYNFRINAKNNVKDHYDISNELFDLFLDESMTYSSGYFKEPNFNLKQAQHAKLDNLFLKSGLKHNDHILDIGCGWGALIIRAVEKFNCTGVAVTLSKNQYEFTKDKINKLNLSDRITVVLEDYRNLNGQFDKIFSVEMLEAVGHSGLKDFFIQSNKLLKNNGILSLQVITVPNERYESYRRNCDFIQKYIFPGGLLLSHKYILETMNKNSNLIEKEYISIGEHYVKTLEHWKENFSNNLDKINTLGFSDKFIRKFIYYFSYCQAAFDAKHIDNLQIFMRKK